MFLGLTAGLRSVRCHARGLPPLNPRMLKVGHFVVSMSFWYNLRSWHTFKGPALSVAMSERSSSVSGFHAASFKSSSSKERAPSQASPGRAYLQIAT